MKTRAIRIHEFGGPEVMQWASFQLPDPADGEARIRHTAGDPVLLYAADTLFKFIGSGNASIRVGQRYALKDAAQAHRDLAARKTTGSTILVP
jgi:NADPH:quinone reductase-like Zn-dependent oxidoreductase